MVWTIEKRLEDCATYKGLRFHWDTKKENILFSLQERKTQKSLLSSISINPLSTSSNSVNNTTNNTQESHNSTQEHSCEGKNLCLRCNSKLFRITTLGNRSIVISYSDEWNEILEHWNQLDQFIPMFAAYYYEECKKMQQTPSKKQILEIPNVVEFVFTKISALIREEEKMRQQNHPTDDNDNNHNHHYNSNNNIDYYDDDDEQHVQNKFIKIFGNLGVCDNILHHWRCSLWKDKYQPGIMYLTENFLCFNDFKGSQKLHFPLTSLYNIQLSQLSYPFYNCLKFQHMFKEYCIVDLENTSKSYNILLPIWQNALNSYYTNLQRTLDQHSLESFENLLLSMKRNQKIERRHSDVGGTPSPSSNIIGRRSKCGIPFSANSVLNNSVHSSEEYIIPLFTNPSNETLFIEKSALSLTSLSVDLISGVTMISKDLMVFRSIEESISIVIPIIEIQQTKQIKSLEQQWKISILIKVKHIRNSFQFYFNNWEPFPFLFQRNHTNQRKLLYPKYRFVDESSAHWMEKQSIFYRSMLSNDEKKDEAAKNKKWTKYFNQYGIGITMIRTERLRKLIIGGIPHNRRECMWQILSNSWYKKNSIDSYESYLERSKKEYDPETLHEIEKDLRRSMPEHPYFRKLKSIEALRRVLVAFATRNKSIGYCQGMNYVCSLLLLFMEEEEAFMLLCTICEDIIPDYYSSSMVGSMIDLEVFEVLMSKYLPEIHRHLLSSVGPAKLITIPWFMSLFIGILPWELTFRLFDMLFSEGSRALFIYGLSLFQVHHKEVLQIKNCDGINRFKELILKMELKPFLKWVYHFESLISVSEIINVRDSQTLNIMKRSAEMAACKISSSSSSLSLSSPSAPISSDDSTSSDSDSDDFCDEFISLLNDGDFSPDVTPSFLSIRNHHTDYNDADIDDKKKNNLPTNKNVRRPTQSTPILRKSNNNNNNDDDGGGSGDNKSNHSNTARRPTRNRIINSTSMKLNRCRSDSPKTSPRQLVSSDRAKSLNRATNSSLRISFDLGALTADDDDNNHNIANNNNNNISGEHNDDDGDDDDYVTIIQDNTKPKLSSVEIKRTTLPSNTEIRTRNNTLQSKNSLNLVTQHRKSMLSFSNDTIKSPSKVKEKSTGIEKEFLYFY